MQSQGAKVLILFTSSALGGAERSLSRMAFRAKGAHYQLATLQGEGAWSQWVRSRGHEPLVLGRRSSRGHSSMLGSMLRLFSHLRASPVDVIYVCGVRASLLLRLLRFLAPKARLIHGVRSNLDSDSRLDRLFRLMERLTHPLVDAWITNSAVAKQTLVMRCGIPTERVHVIYNGVESWPDDIPPLNRRPFEVLTVANLNPRKGHREYLRTISAVIESVPDARFVFVGRDDMSGDVERAVEQAELGKFVRYEGFQADVSPWLKRARVFVLPSLRDEGCPTSILEAMSYSIPCVAFSIDGIPEMIDSGQQGLLCKYGDYPGMADSIIHLLMNESAACTLGSSGQERARRYFTLDSCADHHSKIIAQIILDSEAS